LDHGTVFRGQSRNRPLDVPHRAEILLDARLVLAPEVRFHRARIILHGVENALLPIHPGALAHAEQPVEQLMRQHLRRQRTVAIGPAQIALNALAERLLRYTDLQRAEARFFAQLPRNHLVDRRAAGAAPGIGLARDQRAHGRVVAVAGTRQTRRRTIQAGDDVDVLP